MAGVNDHVQTISMNCKIAVIEDNASVRDSIRLVLEQDGFDVFLFKNGEAILSGDIPDVDLFLIDKQLNGVDGIDLCRYVRGTKDFHNAPVVIMSAFYDGYTLARSAGASGFLEKPFDRTMLRDVIDIALGKKC